MLLMKMQSKFHMDFDISDSRFFFHVTKIKVLSMSTLRKKGRKIKF